MWVTPEQARLRDNAQMTRWRLAYPEAWKALGKRWRDGVRYRCLAAYSNGLPSCACCEEETFEFLTLDHIDGGGNEARRREGHRGGTAQYSRLSRQGFPPGYQVLCWNCNAAKGLYGECPHVTAEAFQENVR